MIQGIEKKIMHFYSSSRFPGKSRIKVRLCKKGKIIDGIASGMAIEGLRWFPFATEVCGSSAQQTKGALMDCS